jgi:hypothetical protein
MVGHQTLNLAIGVRVPASQPFIPSALFNSRWQVNAKSRKSHRKVGRTTGESVGTIRNIHFRFIIEYEGVGIIEYEGVGKVGFLDQVFCPRHLNGGDSGSLVLDGKTKTAVGLHFAGFPDKKGVMGSVFNPSGN